MSVFRAYVEKLPAFAVAAGELRGDLEEALGLSLPELHLLNRYDLENLSPEAFQLACSTILSEPQVDDCFFENPYTTGYRVFAIEYLPGQFDQRADSCAQCIQLSTVTERPIVRTARVFAIPESSVTEAQFATIKDYLINPVECREAALTLPETLTEQCEIPTTVETLTGFIGLDSGALSAFVSDYGLAMDADDIAFCQRYFRDTEERDPTITEIRLIDTYWSDHCRHTTFLTQLQNVEIQSPEIKKSFERYLSIREKLYEGRPRPMTLMDLAVIGQKALKAEGLLPDLDESEEINACSVKVSAQVNGAKEDWLLMFKNETHNHPTEIEPFGGAATCLGGAIRDPLSGRSYVYQAMRVTGAGDPLTPLSETLQNKLPQRKIVTTAAAGYSSYGNQIGLATGQVEEIYHPGYVAKRMEIGAVVGAAPAGNVVRKVPAAGDVVVLLGGKTGRDGCGGATGSSKVHTTSSLSTCAAEVQKGNAPEERKLQRLFRDPAVTALIKRCNDFGAGGVSVAIGELADGLTIDLNRVPQKYEGLDGTELAISESQERMAVVVAPENVERFMALAAAENLLATPVATVTEEPRLRMQWNGVEIVSLSREFLNSNGAAKQTDVVIEEPTVCLPECAGAGFADVIIQHMASLKCCSQKGLVERFDSTIGGGTVLMPFGGLYQMTPIQAMAAKLPVLHGDTTTCSLMAYGFDPLLSAQSPYHGAIAAVVESVAKVVATGGDERRCWLTFQEYFGRTKNDPRRWGMPTAALLGALEAQVALSIGAIGGKDSMSGSFEELDVPPTLVSFAVSIGSVHDVVAPQFKGAGNNVYLLAPKLDQRGLPVLSSVKETFAKMRELMRGNKAHSVWAVGKGGALEGLVKMSLGNRLGFNGMSALTLSELCRPCYGAFLFESEVSVEEALYIGATVSEFTFSIGTETVDMETVQSAYEHRLEPVFPCLSPSSDRLVESYSYSTSRRATPAIKCEKPRVVIPVFPGTNCEYDTARAFEAAGADPEILLIKNLSSKDIEQSIAAMKKAIDSAQIIALPGGFSGGDEPDGSAKFITSFFRNPQITQAVHELLNSRDGLMIGICNGFQALIKLGLLPFGQIADTDRTSATLTYNAIGRHQSMLVRTRIASNKSPWLSSAKVGEIHTIPISHGEGRFIADDTLIDCLAANGQIATQYVDMRGFPTADVRYNPNDSKSSIEGITSPDGRIFGKMGHSERYGDNLYRNVPGDKNQRLFENAVNYYSI